MDRYYTPEPLARDLLRQCSFVTNAARVVDPSCGGGALLSAAEAVFGASSCVGIDFDRSTIRALRRRKPHWSLAVADLLCERSVRRSCRSLGSKTALVPDVLLLNPPFSQAGRKFVEHQRADGTVMRVGRAMQFLLQAVTLFMPTVAIFAIVPESLVYSELDADARDLIESRFEMREIAALKTTAFEGARVRSIAVEFRRSLARNEHVRTNFPALISVGFERGSLPVHLAIPSRGGVPFVHSSDLVPIAERRFFGGQVEGGRICKTGWSLLLPRVGVPKCGAIKASYFSRPIRLSDCVIALWCSEKSAAKLVEKVILDDWDGFINIYRGTGARYITVAKLTRWLSTKGIASEKL